MAEPCFGIVERRIADISSTRGLPDPLEAHICGPDEDIHQAHVWAFQAEPAKGPKGSDQSPPAARSASSDLRAGTSGYARKPTSRDSAQFASATWNARTGYHRALVRRCRCSAVPVAGDRICQVPSPASTCDIQRSHHGEHGPITLHMKTPFGTDASPVLGPCTLALRPSYAR